MTAADEAACRLMGRLLRGLPELEPEATEETQGAQPQSGRDWFDRFVRRQPEADGGDAA